MLGIGMGVFMSTLDSSIVNVSLPTLVEELHTSLAMIEWVILAYLLVVTSLILTMARLGDMFGKKKFYTLGLGLFTAGSLLCGLAPGILWLIGFRALQGLGAVMMFALGAAIITEVFPPQQRGQALGIMGGIVSVGIAIGPSLGGLLIGLVGWRSIFLVNVPVGVAAMIIVARVVPPSTIGLAGQRFDLIGALLLFATLSSYALGMTLGQHEGFAAPHTLGLLGFALLGLIGFVALESRLEQPMIDLRLFGNPLFGINLLMGFLVFIMIGGYFLLPFYLELVKGFPTEQVGLMLVVFPALMGLTAPISGTLSDRFGSRAISLIGLAVIVVACLLISTLDAGVGIPGYVLRLAPLGIGMGMFNSPNNSAIMGAAPRDRLGLASGLTALSRSLGQTSGLPLMGALFAFYVRGAETLPPGLDITAASSEALVAGLQATFRIAAGFILVAAILGALALYLDQRQREAAADAAPLAEVTLSQR